MPKQSKADDPTFRLIGRIPRPIGSSPRPHDLPAEAWARLFAAALMRLQRAKPRWASATAVQVDNLLASWLVFNRDPSLSRPELDLRLEEVLEHLEAHPPWGVKARGGTRALRPARRRQKGSRK
jgi:hypothetical protein